jgi:hypothetical protein
MSHDFTDHLTLSRRGGGLFLLLLIFGTKFYRKKYMDLKDK